MMDSGKPVVKHNPKCGATVVFQLHNTDLVAVRLRSSGITGVVECTGMATTPTAQHWNGIGLYAVMANVFVRELDRLVEEWPRIRRELGLKEGE